MQKEEINRKTGKLPNPILSKLHLVDLYQLICDACQDMGKDLTICNNKEASEFLESITQVKMGAWQKLILPAMRNGTDAPISKNTLQAIWKGFEAKLPNSKSIRVLGDCIEGLKNLYFTDNLPATKSLSPQLSQESLSSIRKLLGEYVVFYVSRRNVESGKLNDKNPILSIDMHSASFVHQEEGIRYEWYGKVAHQNNDFIYILLQKGDDVIFLLLEVNENDEVNSMKGLLSSVNVNKEGYTMPVFLLKGKSKELLFTEKPEREKRIVRFFRTFRRNHLLKLAPDFKFLDKRVEDELSWEQALSGVYYMYRYGQVMEEQGKIVRSVLHISCEDGNTQGITARMRTLRNDYHALCIERVANNFLSIVLKSDNSTKIFHVNVRLRVGTEQLKTIGSIFGAFSSTGSQESDCSSGNLVLVRKKPDAPSEATIVHEDSEEYIELQTKNILNGITNFYIYSGQNAFPDEMPEYKSKVERGKVIFGDYNADDYAYVGLIHEYDRQNDRIRFLTVAGAGHCSFQSNKYDYEPTIEFDYLFAKNQRFFYEESDWLGEVMDISQAFKKIVLVVDYVEKDLEKVLKMEANTNKEFHLKMDALRNFTFIGKVTGDKEPKPCKLFQIRTLQHRPTRQKLDNNKS